LQYDFSVVIPVYNGALTLPSLIKELYESLSAYHFELILVNDGSKDNSKEVCTQLCADYPHIRFINLRKNFGEFNTVLCGLSKANGQYAVIIDDDFQNPPSEIVKLYKKASSEKLDVVYSSYKIKKHNFFRNLGSSFINFLSNFIYDKPKGLYLSSFKVIEKGVIDEIIKYRGPYPFIDGLIFQVTNSVGSIEVQHNERAEGRSNYTYRKLVALFFDAIIGYSIIPIRLFQLIGLFIVLYALISSIFELNYIFHKIPPGNLLNHGLIILAISVVGEYLGKSFMMISGKPQYVIKDEISSENKV
jgi:glycosyltransferase involved in cell wall biosynthesis